MMDMNWMEAIRGEYTDGWYVYDEAPADAPAAPLSAPVLDFCGAPRRYVRPDAPDEGLVVCTEAAKRLRDAPVLLLADDTLWSRADATLLFVSAKQAGAEATLALLSAQAEPEARAERRRRVVADWGARCGGGECQ